MPNDVIDKMAESPKSSNPTQIGSSDDALINDFKIVFRRRDWLCVFHGDQDGQLSWLSTEGLVVTAAKRLPVGCQVWISLRSPYHILHRIPADIVRAEPCKNSFRYSMRFQLEELPEEGRRGARMVLQQLTHSLQH